MILCKKENDMRLEKYLSMTRWERAEWIKSEIIQFIALGQDIKIPIFKALLMEAPSNQGDGVQ